MSYNYKRGDHRPDVVLVIDGTTMHIDFETRSRADLDPSDRQMMAYAAGLDYGLTEGRVLAYMMDSDAMLHTLDLATVSPADLGTEMHKRLEADFAAMDERINYNGKRDIMLKKAVDQMRPMCLEGSRPGKRRKVRDWDQRDRKYRGR